MSKLKLQNGDCLKLMKDIPDNSVDMIFSDPPYNTTNNSWDCKVDLVQMWKEFKRILKKNGVVVLWAQAPFSHALAMSNISWYRYEWVIEKTKATGHLNAKKMPMKAHENLMVFAENDIEGTTENESIETLQVFYKKLPTYNPQMTDGHPPVHSYTKHTTDGNCYGKTQTGISGGGSTKRYPRDVLKFKWDTQKSSLHPCQKPLEACKYIVETYTNEGDTILDPFMGSNTTGLACKELNRNYIGIEKENDIYNIAVKRTS